MYLDEVQRGGRRFRGRFWGRVYLDEGSEGGKEVQGEGEGSVYLNQDSRSLQELHLLQDLLLEAVPGHRALYKQHEGVSKPTHTQI